MSACSWWWISPCELSSLKTFGFSFRFSPSISLLLHTIKPSTCLVLHLSPQMSHSLMLWLVVQVEGGGCLHYALSCIVQWWPLWILCINTGNHWLLFSCSKLNGSWLLLCSMLQWIVWCFSWWLQCNCILCSPLGSFYSCQRCRLLPSSGPVLISQCYFSDSQMRWGRNPFLILFGILLLWNQLP